MPFLDATQPIDAFLTATAAKQPTPGGGAVAALCGATAAAIGEMVLNYSVGRKANAPDADADLREALAELTRARSLMLGLLIEDQQAYADLTAAKKLPDDDPTKPARTRSAVNAAIAVPQSIAATSLAILGLCDRVAATANRWLLSDLAVCVELSMAALRSALHNVTANLADVDAASADRYRKESADLLARGVAIARSLVPRIMG